MRYFPPLELYLPIQPMTATPDARHSYQSPARHLHRVISTAVEWLYPRLCAVCGLRLQSAELAVCTHCASRLARYEAQFYHGDERLYASPIFRHLYTIYAFRKGTEVQRLIHAFKYHHYRAVGRLIALQLLQLHPLSQGRYDAVVAIPMDRRRQRTRGFNQAMEIARHIAHHLGIPGSDTWIVKARPSESQTCHTRLERHERIGKLFRLNKHAEAHLRGKRILLIDDLLTTGATLVATLDLLEQAGAIEVDVATAAVSLYDYR